ncbi:MAG: CsbD family protein [Enterocloster bolteae]
MWQITAKYFDIESYKRKCYIIIDKGFTDQVKGQGKEENVGDITGDKSTKSEGLLDQAVGKVKEVVADVKDVIDEVTDKAKEKMNKE